MKIKGMVTNIILIYMLICAHTNTNIILKCANKNNMKYYVDNLVLCEDFDQYSFINLSNIGSQVSEKHPGWRVSLVFLFFLFLSARQPLPTFLSPWLVMLDLKIIFFLTWVKKIRVKLKIWTDVVAPSSVIRKLKYIYKNPK